MICGLAWISFVALAYVVFGSLANDLEWVGLGP